MKQHCTGSSLAFKIKDIFLKIGRHIFNQSINLFQCKQVKCSTDHFQGFSLGLLFAFSCFHAFLYFTCNFVLNIWINCEYISQITNQCFTTVCFTTHKMSQCFNCSFTYHTYIIIVLPGSPFFNIQSFWTNTKLDWVGPVDNRPSTNKLHHFVQKKNNKKLVTCDMWHVTCDTWHVTCDTWNVTCLGGWTFSQKFNSLALTVCDLRYYEDLEEKADSANELFYHEAVYRTAQLHRVC